MSDQEDISEINEDNKSECLTKTKAKKSVLIFVDKNQKTKILKEIKKILPDSQSPNELEKNDNTIKYLLEFNSYEKAKQGKEKLKSSFKTEQVRVESALYEKKKEIRKKEKEESNKNGNFKELNGQLGDRSRNLFEIRKPRLILRNLSFKFTDELLKTELEKYGKVVEVSLPKKDDGKMRGYGFVTYENMNEARKAMEELNNRVDKLLGTKVAVDWCLPKNLYLKNNEENEKKEQNVEKNEAENDTDNDENEKESEIEENEDDEDDEDDEKENKKLDKKKANTKKNKVVVNEKFEKKKKEGTKDVQEKRTVFVRNLSFDTTEYLVKEAFSKFGTVKFVKLCFDRELERPKGTAFVQFETQDSAINACAESEIFEMDERKLAIDMAISRTQANEITEERKTAKTETKDSRNLALAKEGIIYANSYEARGLSKADLLRREKLEKGNAEKLKLLHYFVSPTRLSVHNIPISCTDEEIKRIFLNSIGVSTDLPAKKSFKSTGLVECRIMRDLTRVNSEGIARSKGYGFVEFKTFDLAKKALHATNNNPELFKNGQRLIVQFSIEDMRALNKKKKRIEKSKNVLNKNSRFNNKKSSEKKSEKTNLYLDDDSINIDKMKQKNLLKVHNLEKKLDKRKNEEEHKQVKKQRRQDLNEKRLIEKETRNENKMEKQRQMKQMKRQRLKENRSNNRKLQNRKDNQVDDVDKLVEKLYQSKVKKEEKKSKWYE